MSRDILCVIAALFLLTLGADLLVRGASAIARRAGLSSFMVGLTIVGFGTSAPELASSVSAALRGWGDIAVGNVIGSNCFNVAAVLGATALVCPIGVRLAAVRREVLVLIAVSFVPFAALLTDGVIGRGIGAVLLVLLAVYVWRGIVEGRREAALLEAAPTLADVTPAPVDARDRMAVAIACALFGLVLLVAGSTVLVGAASSLARDAGLSERVIGLTIVAVGTSTPEFVTSLVAAFRGQPDLAVGNVLGSNTFNVLGILGATTFVAEQRVSDAMLAFDAPYMVLLSVALLPIVTSAARISRLEGALLLTSYVVYVGLLLGRP